MKGSYLAKALALPSSQGWEGFLQWCHNPADHKMVQRFGHARVGSLVTTQMFWNFRSLLTHVKQRTKSIRMKKRREKKLYWISL